MGEQKLKNKWYCKQNLSKNNMVWYSVNWNQNLQFTLFFPHHSGIHSQHWSKHILLEHNPMELSNCWWVPTSISIRRWPAGLVMFLQKSLKNVDRLYICCHQSMHECSSSAISLETSKDPKNLSTWLFSVTPLTALISDFLILVYLEPP